MKRFLLITFFILALSSAAFPKDETYGSITVSRVLKVYDGDTFHCDINQWPPIIGKNIKIRIGGIDTPEMKCSKKMDKSKCKKNKELARNARRLAENLLKRAKKVELRNTKRDKYFRIVADVFADGKDVAKILIKNKLAKPYDGGKKSKW